MIGLPIGIILTLLGIYCARAAVERWNMTPLQTLCLGWGLGMVFVVVLLVLSSATRAA